jgi:hypothetical protein
MREIATTAVLAVAAVLLAGCTGGTDAPTDADEQAFCDTYVTYWQLVAEAELNEQGIEDGARVAREWGHDLEAVGTPADTPDEARDGFEVLVEGLATIEDDDTQADVNAIEDDFRREERDAGEAFIAWANATCPLPSAEYP